MASSAPSTMNVTNELVEAHDSVQTGGSGSSPGSCVPPAEAGSVASPSEQARTNGASNLFIYSPCVESVNGDGRAPAVTPHYTVNDVPDLVLFQTLTDRRDFDALHYLCRKRKTEARTDAEEARWVKDHAIVYALEGLYAVAFDLLAGGYRTASRIEGSLRGRYEDEMGLVLVETNRTATALEHFHAAYAHHLKGGSMRGCMAVEHNTGRAHAARGDYGKAMDCFKHALDFARATDDYRLESEVLDSILEFGIGRIEGGEG